MLATLNNDPDLLKKLITGDELWVYGCYIETKAISFEAPRRAKTEKSTSTLVKSEGYAHLDCNGVLHHEFLPQEHTVNKEYCVEVMHRLRETIRQKCTEL